MYSRHLTRVSPQNVCGCAAAQPLPRANWRPVRPQSDVVWSLATLRIAILRRRHAATRISTDDEHGCAGSASFETRQMQGGAMNPTESGGRCVSMQRKPQNKSEESVYLGVTERQREEREERERGREGERGSRPDYVVGCGNS